MSNISSDFPTRQPAPKIGSNGTWLEWDEQTQAYVDTGKPSRGDRAALSDAIKTALLTIAEKAGYSDTHGQDYYDALYAALYPPAELLTITASFAQGSHTVYDTDTLESLKPYLTVTGAYDDGTSRTITDYTLSGTLTEGSSTITVTAGGKTASFTVTVTATPEPGTDWEDGVPYTFEVIENEYCGNIGIKAYNGWSRTPYLPCRGAGYISLNKSIGTGAYSCWYDKDKKLITAFSPLPSNLRSIPAEACFVMVSQEDSVLRAAMPITPHAAEE